jgi:hypothetical protein
MVAVAQLAHLLSGQDAILLLQFGQENIQAVVNACTCPLRPGLRFGGQGERLDTSGPEVARGALEAERRGFQPQNLATRLVVGNTAAGPSVGGRQPFASLEKVRDIG